MLSVPQMKRLAVMLWAAAVLGAVAVTVGVLPAFTSDLALPAPLWLILLASSAQSAVLVALAVWSGVALASKIGLNAPAFQAAASGGSIANALRPQIVPGLVFGVLAGAFLFVSIRLSPAPIVALQERFQPPLFARLLYGGITEEVLLRWGVMTAFAWLAWRFLQRRNGDVKPGIMWLAIVSSALLFGAGHLPAAKILLGTLDSNVLLFVVGVNSAFGVLFGWLYWRRGLESAMVAQRNAPESASSRGRASAAVAKPATAGTKSHQK